MPGFLYTQGDNWDVENKINYFILKFKLRELSFSHIAAGQVLHHRAARDTTTRHNYDTTSTLVVLHPRPVVWEVFGRGPPKRSPAAD